MCVEWLRKAAKITREFRYIIGHACTTRKAAKAILLQRKHLWAAGVDFVGGGGWGGSWRMLKMYE